MNALAVISPPMGNPFVAQASANEAANDSALNANLRSSAPSLWPAPGAPRYGRLAVVVALHVALFWGLWHAVVERKTPQVVPVSLQMFLPQAEKLELPKPKPQVSPRPIPKLDTPPVVIPQAEVPVASSMVLPQAQADPPAAPRAAPPVSQPVAPPVTVAARVELPSSSADYLSNPAPVYPPASKRQREQGRVLLYVLVDVKGLPQKIELKASSGFNRLDEAAIATVQKWKFVPGKRNGVVEEMWVEVPIEFRLQG